MTELENKKRKCKEIRAANNAWAEEKDRTKVYTQPAKYATQYVRFEFLVNELEAAWERIEKLEEALKKAGNKSVEEYVQTNTEKLKRRTKKVHEPLPKKPDVAMARTGEN